MKSRERPLLSDALLLSDLSRYGQTRVRMGMGAVVEQTKSEGNHSTMRCACWWCSHGGIAAWLIAACRVVQVVRCHARRGAL